jgi:predicted nucleic acid-binding protein
MRARCWVGSSSCQRTRRRRQLATALGAAYGLRVADAVRLAAAVGAGADRFVTSNRSDFPKSITEIDVVYPDELPSR